MVYKERRISIIEFVEKGGIESIYSPPSRKDDQGSTKHIEC